MKIKTKEIKIKIDELESWHWENLDKKVILKVFLPNGDLILKFIVEEGEEDDDTGTNFARGS